MGKNILDTIYGKFDLGSAQILGNAAGESDLEMGIFFDIHDLSEDVKAIIANAVEEQKAEIEKEYKDLLEEKRKHWSESGETVIHDKLYMYMLAGQPPKYSVDVSYTDSEDENLELWIDIKLDMTKYEPMFKKVAMEMIANELFGR